MMNKYNMQCDITLIYSNMISLISSIFPANIADKRLFKAVPMTTGVFSFHQKRKGCNNMYVKYSP